MSSTEPYWWLAATPPALPQTAVQPACDVAIVGAGYTGLSAAITLARAGRSVQVFDKQRPGEGASTRNGGITSGNLRPGYAEMARRFGRERADAIQAEAVEARADLYRFIAEEGIDCDFKLVGRFSGAATPWRLRARRPRGRAAGDPAWGSRRTLFPRAEQKSIHRYGLLLRRQRPHGHWRPAPGEAACRHAPPGTGRRRAGAWGNCRRVRRARRATDSRSAPPAARPPRAT